LDLDNDLSEMKRFTIFFVLLWTAAFCDAQIHIEKFYVGSDSLSSILFDFQAEEDKSAVARQLEQITFDFLITDASLSFEFDSLRYAKYLKAEDESFTLLTWVVPLSGGHYRYFGFLQKISDKSVDTVYQLKPAGEATDPYTHNDFQSWPAAVYTQILPRDKKEDYYTLMAWVGKSEGLSGKRIETLAFDSLGHPVFGIPVFSMKNGNTQNRVDFEYTAELPFHLSYELQKLPDEKRKTGWMIVFNRIGGNTPGMGRMFRGPVPSFDIFDAFVKIGRKWVLFEDIDPRVNTKKLISDPPSEIGLPDIKK
jgi:hypothetical protein